MRDHPSSNELDSATSSRLARLATMPVNTSNLDHRLHAALESNALDRSRSPRPRLVRFLATAAASIAILITVGLFLTNLGNTPVLASPTNLARIHAEAIDHRKSESTVTTVEQANRVLAGQWSDTPLLPTPSAGQLRACCVHSFKDRKVACLILDDGGTPLTMVVGHARDIRCPNGHVVERGGRKFTLHEVKDLRMVMTEHDGRYVCLMGEVPEDRLLELAEGIKF